MNYYYGCYLSCISAIYRKLTITTVITFILSTTSIFAQQPTDQNYLKAPGLTLQGVGITTPPNWTMFMNFGVFPPVLSMTDASGVKLSLFSIDPVAHTASIASGVYLKLTDATSNASGSLGTLPANSFISNMLCRETTGNSVNISVGSITSAFDVLSPVAIPGNGTLSIDITAFSKAWFSATSPQAVYLSSAAWNGASVNCLMNYQAGP